MVVSGLVISQSNVYSISIGRVRIGLGASGGELGKVRGKVRGEEREEWARCKSSDGEVPRLPPPLNSHPAYVRSTARYGTLGAALIQ